MLLLVGFQRWYDIYNNFRLFVKPEQQNRTHYFLFPHLAMKKSALGKAVDLTKKPSMSIAPSTWSHSGSTLTSRIYFPFESSIKKERSIRKTIRSAISGIPRTIKVLKEPKFLVLLVEAAEQDEKNEGIGIQSRLVRRTLDTSTSGYAIEA